MPIGALAAPDQRARQARQAARRCARPQGQGLDLYLTEFGYLTEGNRAQSPRASAPPGCASAYDIARRNPRVKQILQYQLVDPPAERALALGDPATATAARRAPTPASRRPSAAIR